MKKHIFIVFSIILTFMASAYAEQSKYSIIVDAGSSGSRLHLFQYNSEKALPVINDVFSEKISPGLSTFAGKSQEEVNQYLKPLFAHVAQKIKDMQVDEQSVTVSIMATAGMRLVPEEKQKIIYDQVKHFLTKNHTFQIVKVETINGKMEGLYGWLDINYLAQTFQTKTPTFGSIDMGGASTQIAFETKGNTHPNDMIMLNINGRPYTIFSKSFLGLGLDQSREAMNKQPAANKCYPIGYKLPNGMGDFNSVTCKSFYSKIISEKEITKQLAPLNNQKFMAYSGVYYAYRILDALPADQRLVEKQIQNYCGEKDWNWWLQKYPAESLAFLPNYCANGVYLSHLFYDTYQIKSDAFQVVENINKQAIDWTLGALLHQLVEKK